jgi:hypothetical protein
MRACSSSGDFPVAELAATQILSLPMFPTLSRDSQRRVVTEVSRATAPESGMQAVERQAESTAQRPRRRPAVASVSSVSPVSPALQAP